MPSSDSSSSRRIPRVPEVDASDKTTQMPTTSDADRTVVAGRSSATRQRQGTIRPVAPAGQHAAPRDDAYAGGGRRNARRRNGSRKKRRGPFIALVVVIVLVVALYVGGVAAFTFLFYPNTSIAGIDVSLLTADDATTKLDAEVDGYTLTVEDADLGFSWTYEPEGGRDIFDTAAAVNTRIAQNESWAWPVRLYQALTEDSSSVSSSTTEDILDTDPDLSLFGASFNRTDFETSLGDAVDTFNSDRSGTFDASSAWDADTGAFTLEQANSARQLNRDNIITVALNALAALDEDADLTVLDSDDLYLPLADGLTDEQIQSICDTANGFLDTNLTFKLGGADAGTLTGSDIASWITFDATTEPTLDSSAVAAWASELAQNMNTVGTERTYTRPDGETITISGGTFGWEVDQDALVQTVQDAVANHQTGDIDVPTTSEGDTYAGLGQPDWGAYVDVDISEQYARYYDADGNLLWETGVVTGIDDGEHDTPTGVYKVNAKMRNITLVSQNTDPETGEPDYESPVDYWIPFKGSSWGFHDASWQPDWVYTDSSAYHTYGSHGCVNTPYDKVAELYDLVEVGTCVIVHE